MFTNYVQHRERGATLIELLIAMALSALLISLIITIYLISIRNTELQKNLSQIESNAKEALALFTHEIELAGHRGCARLDFAIPNFSPTNRLIGNGTDTLSVKYMAYPTVNLLHQYKQALDINAAIQFKENDKLIIADCEQAEIFTVKSVQIWADKKTLYLWTPLQHTYSAHAEIGKFRERTFYIAPSKRTHENTLYLQEDGKHIELINGIRQLTFSYTIGDTYLQQVAAQAVTDWSKVKGVGIEMLIEAGGLVKTWYGYAALGGGEYAN